MTEQLILGEMLSLLIEENTDLEVEITHGVGGGTSNIQPALIKGEFDLYPEYTGTGWNFVLKEEGKVIQYGTPREVVENPNSDFVRKLIGKSKPFYYDTVKRICGESKLKEIFEILKISQ